MVPTHLLSQDSSLIPIKKATVRGKGKRALLPRLKKQETKERRWSEPGSSFRQVRDTVRTTRTPLIRHYQCLTTFFSGQSSPLYNSMHCNIETNYDDILHHTVSYQLSNIHVLGLGRPESFLCRSHPAHRPQGHPSWRWKAHCEELWSFHPWGAKSCFRETQRVSVGLDFTVLRRNFIYDCSAHRFLLLLRIPWDFISFYLFHFLIFFFHRLLLFDC